MTYIRTNKQTDTQILRSTYRTENKLFFQTTLRMCSSFWPFCLQELVKSVFSSLHLLCSCQQQARYVMYVAWVGNSSMMYASIVLICWPLCNFLLLYVLPTITIRYFQFRVLDYIRRMCSGFIFPRQRGFQMCPLSSLYTPDTTPKKDNCAEFDSGAEPL